MARGLKRSKKTLMRPTLRVDLIFRSIRITADVSPAKSRKVTQKMHDGSTEATSATVVGNLRNYAKSDPRVAFLIMTSGTRASPT